MNEHLRQTGRTSRMIQEACRMARCGFAVYVLFETRELAKLGQVRVDQAWEKLTGDFLHLHGIKVESLYDLGNWRWDRMELAGAHQNVKVLLDHTLIEHRIEQLQKEMKLIAKEVAQLYPLTL